MFATTARLFFTTCSAGHTITYMTACCWNNSALSAIEKLFKIKTNKPIRFKIICNSFQFLKTEIVPRNDQENYLLSQEGNIWTAKLIQQYNGDKKNMCMMAVLYMYKILYSCLRHCLKYPEKKILIAGLNFLHFF